MKTVAELWDGYRTKVMPPDAGPNQVIETRRAFYAAVLCTLECMFARAQDSVTGADIVADAESLARMFGECRRFVDAVNEGTM